MVIGNEEEEGEEEVEEEEEEEEDEGGGKRFGTITTATVRMKRRRMLDIGVKEVNEGPDWLDKSWRKKGVIG